MSFYLTEQLPGDSLENSSKPHTPYRGLRLSGLRYYNPDLGRWINRDPIRELSTTIVPHNDHAILAAHISTLSQTEARLNDMIKQGSIREDRMLSISQGNTYHFVKNTPVARIDLFGLSDCSCFDFKLFRSWCEWGFPYIWQCHTDVEWDGGSSPESDWTVSFSIEPKCDCECKDKRAWVETWHTPKYGTGEVHWPAGGAKECNFNVGGKKVCNFLGGGSAGIVELPVCFIAVDNDFKPGSRLKIRWGTGGTTCGTPEWTVVK